jgi:hypothetical protein
MLKYTQLLTEIQIRNMWKTNFLMLDFVIRHHAKKRGVMALQMMRPEKLRSRVTAGVARHRSLPAQRP